MKIGMRAGLMMGFNLDYSESGWMIMDFWIMRSETIWIAIHTTSANANADLELGC